MKKEPNLINQYSQLNGAFSLAIDYRERKRLEMKRRMGVLHHKRSCLERELIAIKKSLIALDQEMQRDQSLEKLSN